MGGDEGVISRRQPARNTKFAIRVGNRKVRVLGDADVGKHPWMDITLDADKIFRERKTFFRDHALDWLGEIEFKICPGSGVNIVELRIEVPNSQSLRGS